MENKKDLKGMMVIVSRKIMLILILLAFFSGCKKTDSTDTQNDLVQVYNPFEYKFVPYNLSTKMPEYGKIPENQKDVFQYSFRTMNEYFTSGDSYTNEFKIIKNVDGELKIVYELENKQTEAIFPLATDGNKMIFFKADYSGESLPLSTVVEYKNDMLYEYKKTKSVISSGAILNNYLYYTTYEDNTDSYDLFQLELGDFFNEPIKIQSGLESHELFILNNVLYLSNDEKIYSENDEFNKASENFYDIESNTLIQLAPNVDNNNQLMLRIIDAKTKNIIGTVDAVIGFEIRNMEIIAYCINKIVTVSLE